jgi:multidrug efflux pump subunit AcrB
MPVLASLFLARWIQQKDTLVVRGLKRLYEPCLRFSMKHPLGMFLTAIGIFAISVLLARQFGREFVPKLDEGDIAIQATRLPSVSLETSVELTKAMERCLLKFPQVITVVSKTGRPEIANDPMGVYQTDVIVRLKPKEQWPEPISKEDLVVQMRKALAREVPANSFSFTQPIELRVQELVAGVRSDIGLSLYGDDLGVLKAKGDEIVQALLRVEGSADVAAQQIAGLSYCGVSVRRDALARYGINAREVLDAVACVGGKVVGQVFEGQRRFPMQVRLAPEWRTDVEKLSQLKVEDGAFGDRRSGGFAFDLFTALCDVQFGKLSAPDLLERTDCSHRWNSGSVGPRDAFFNLGRGRVHRTIRNRSDEWRGPDRTYSASSSPKSKSVRCGGTRRFGSTPASVHDGCLWGPRFHSHGHFEQFGSRGPTTTGYRGDRRIDHFDRFDFVGFTEYISLV